MWYNSKGNNTSNCGRENAAVNTDKQWFTISPHSWNTHKKTTFPSILCLCSTAGKTAFHSLP